jgi:hypothetical protein
MQNRSFLGRVDRFTAKHLFDRLRQATFLRQLNQQLPGFDGN